MEQTNEEKIEMLQEAQDKLFEVIELIEEVFPNDGNIEAYLTDHLRIFAHEEHGFLSSDLNIDELMARILEKQKDARVAALEKG